jgi:3'-phosphoadenosine 5'-phosphosulfate (PAPS) 3'-phosphatase
MQKVTFGALMAAALVRRHLVKYHGGARGAAVRTSGVGASASSARQQAAPTSAQYTLENAVHIACRLAQHVREKFIFGGDAGKSDGAVFGKVDTSPVTIADLSIQVLVTAMLKHILGPDAGPLRLVGEEDAAVFAEGGAASGSGALEAVVALLQEFLPADVAATQAGGAVDAAFVLQMLREAGDEGGEGTFWTLDPIDGTKGFILEGGQCVGMRGSARRGC